MSQEFTPVFKGTAMQFDLDGGNADVFADFIGGTVNNENGMLAVEMPFPLDGQYIIPGDYAVMLDGQFTKMYRDEFESQFGMPA